jgi:hypothetical protein
MTEFINYASADDVKVFTTTNNSHFTHEERHLFIDLEERLRDDPVSQKQIGCFTIPLNRVNELCPSYGSEACFKVTATPTSQGLVSGEIEIEVRKLRVDRGYIQKKTQETAKHLSIQIGNIIRFNEEHSSYKLTSNIQGREGFSLLHAAIQLKEQDLVRKLIKLGANPMTRSDVGTPLSQTLKTRSSVHEKLSKLRMGGAEETAKRAQEKLYTLFESDNGLLKCGSGRPPCSEASYEDPETEKDTATKQIPNSAIESGNLLGDGSRRRFSDPLINLPQRSHFNGVQPAGRLPLLERK